MQITQIGKFYYPIKGGMEDHLYHLCNELKKKFNIVVLVSNNKTKTTIENINGVKIIRVLNLGNIWSTSICPNMFYWLKKLDADIIHLHFPNPMAHLSYLLARPRGKLVIMWQSDIVKNKFYVKLYNPLLLKLLKKAHKIIVHSPIYCEKSSFLNEFRDKCIVIPLGIDVSKFVLTEDEKQKVQEIRFRFNNKIILFVGRIQPYKGLEYLINAFKEIEANLLIIGSGVLEKKMRRLTQSLNMQNKIWFLGEIPHGEIPLYFHACDIFVLPSIERSEAFGIVQLEAMVCGKPVISTNLHTGVPFVNRNKRTGIVVEPRDSRVLEKAMKELLENPKLRKYYGENGRKLVGEEFTKELNAARIVSLYHELCNEI